MQSQKIMALFVKRAMERIGSSADVLLGAVVQDPHPHLPGVGGGEELDAGAVENGTQPGLGIQAQILGDPLLMTLLIHLLHLTRSICISPCFQTLRVLAKVPYFPEQLWTEMGFYENLPGKMPDLQPSIDFLPKGNYTNKIQHTTRSLIP